MAFHEIAVEPDAIQSLRDVQLILSYVGFGKGRLISNYPAAGPCKEREGEDWAWRVVQSVKRAEVGKAKKVEALLTAERKKILRTKRAFDHEHKWIDNARREHVRMRFGAIIVQCPELCEFECCLDEFSGETFPPCLRDDQHVLPLPKLPESFADALMPMIGCASELRFIDPFFLRRNDKGEFVVSPKHGKVVQEIARRLNAINRVPRVVEFHLLELGGDQEDQNKQLSAFAGSMEAHLPKTWKAKAFLWREIPGSRKFHARYVLTDAGGAGSEYGLDQGNSPGDETDLYLLPEPLRARRSLDFSAAGTAFHRAAEPIVFSGIR
jgi:hypothetical protein